MSAHPLSEEDLHALVDQRLSVAETAALERRIRGDRELVDRIVLWRRQSAALSAAFAPIADEPVPVVFLGGSAETMQARRFFWIAVGLLVGLGLGFVMGFALATAGLP